MTNRLNDKPVAGAVALDHHLVAIVAGVVSRILPATLLAAISTVTGRGVLNAADQAAARAAIGAVIGTNVQGYDTDLQALAALSSVGLATRTGAGAWVQSVLAGTTNKIGVTNGDGVAGNPTITIPATFDLSSGHTVALPLGTTFGGTALSTLINSLAALPIGTPIHWPTDTLPTGWLVRDGSLISRTTYAALFAALVTTPGYTGQTFTCTIASPCVVTKNGHGFTGLERLRLTTTGALPTGLTPGNEYFVIYADANTFRLATSEANATAGTAINTSGGQSGTHTYTRSLYGLGDGATTFKLPDDRDLFVRGKASSGRAVGSYQSDAFMGHYHNMNMAAGDVTALQTWGSIAPSTTLASGNPGFNISNVFQITGPRDDGTNGAPRVANETRPVSRAYLPIIKYA